MELGLDFLDPKSQAEFAAKPPVVQPHVEEPIIDKSIEEIKDPPQKSLSSSPYVPLLAKHFAEEGLLSEEYLKEVEEDGTLEGFTAAFSKQIKDLSERNTNKYQTEIKELIELSESGVPREKAKELVKKSLELSKITDDNLESDESLQESLVSEYLTALGLSKDEQTEQIEYLKDTDKLLPKALSSKIKLEDLNNKSKVLEKEKARLEIEHQEKSSKELLNKIRTNLDEKTELIPGVKLSKGDKETIFKNLTTPVAIDDYGNPITYVQSIRDKDPITFEIMLNYYAQQGLFEGKYDKLVRSAKSKTVEELEKTLSNSNIFDSGVSTIDRQMSTEKDKLGTKDLASFIPGSFAELFPKK